MIALRQLRQNPGFTAAVVLTLALGIGATSAIFSLIDHVALRALPVRNPQELVMVPGLHSYPRFERLRERTEIFSGMAATHALLEMEFSLNGQNRSGLGQAKGELVSGSYFEMLGVTARLGRTLQPEDDRAPEISPVAVISHRFWQRIFAGAPDVLGRTIHVRATAGNASTSGLDIYAGATGRPAERTALTIVGVAPPDFFGDTVGVFTDMWIPMMMQPAVMPGRPWLNKENVSFLSILGRLRPGLNGAQASAALSVSLRQILTEEAGTQLTAERRRAIAERVFQLEAGANGFDQFRGGLTQMLQILMGVVGMVLLMVCLNVANLLMARGAARRHELGVRLALGAGRRRLLRQLLTESLLLGILGGVFGLAVAMVGIRLLVALASGGYQTIDLPLLPNLRTLGFTAAVSLFATLIFGAGPALRASRLQITDALKGAAGRTTDRQRSRAAKTLVGLQVAVSVILLAGAGLLLKSLHQLRDQDVGFDPEPLVMMRLDPVSAGYHGDAIGRACQNLLERVEALPGVRSATYSENGLFHGPESGTQIDVDGFTPASEDDKRVRFDQIGPGYFSTVGIPLLQGRDIETRDGPSAPRVVVINESLAKFYFAKKNPIGQHIHTQVGSRRFDLEIVGVARDAQDHSFWWKPLRRFYVPYLQPIDGIAAANFAIRAAGPVASLETQLRRTVESMDSRLMVLRIRPLQNLMDQSLAQTRLITRLSSCFGLLAVVLVAVGLYGVIAYEVVQRRREIGVRMALGAQRRNVLGLILRQGMTIVGIGAAAGVAGSLGLTRVLEAWLYEIRPADPATLLATLGLLMAVALFACWWPARRASRLNPTEALRAE